MDVKENAEVEVETPHHIPDASQLKETKNSADTSKMAALSIFNTTADTIVKNGSKISE